MLALFFTLSSLKHYTFSTLRLYFCIWKFIFFCSFSLIPPQLLQYAKPNSGIGFPGALELVTEVIIFWIYRFRVLIDDILCIFYFLHVRFHSVKRMDSKWLLHLVLIASRLMQIWLLQAYPSLCKWHFWCILLCSHALIKLPFNQMLE